MTTFKKITSVPLLIANWIDHDEHREPKYLIEAIYEYLHYFTVAHIKNFYSQISVEEKDRLKDVIDANLHGNSNHHKYNVIAVYCEDIINKTKTPHLARVIKKMERGI